MDLKKMTLLCPCLFGLESILSFEIKKIGGQNIRTTDGRVLFEGDLSMVAKANIWLRTAERVGIVMGSFRAETFTQLFDGTAELPWEDLIGEDDKFPVKGSSINSKLASIPDCQSIVKRAIVRRFEKVYGKTRYAETGAKYQVQFFLHKDIVTLVIDTSGAGLHKRGYRLNANEAPIKETLAAGIIDLARVRSDSLVCDPMCGSGTLVIEAALRALNIAPGIRRRFAAQEWKCFQNTIFDEIRREANTLVRRDANFLAYAYDSDSESVRLTRENAARAGVAARVKVRQADVSAFTPPDQGCIVITNPPYGERMLEQDEAKELCRTLGGVFVPRDDMSYYIISPAEDFEEMFARKAIRRRKLYNGMIRCNLFMYFNQRKETARAAAAPEAGKESGAVSPNLQE